MTKKIQIELKKRISYQLLAIIVIFKSYLIIPIFYKGMFCLTV